ncbi:hypothetical protein KSF_104620 [Reticulibacter mediterranei]|uniref:UspA domain-containing protein n=1 Tax=Reticulibacter mediterranei TaxID=2778369 RepID=A0A8J3IYS7_9CHLR|nr:hypothetical protein KSF_104620 [Reticulibacter mediterranei]
MFKRILVPLDESARAERALPVALRLAQATHGTVILFHAVNPITELWPVPPERWSMTYTVESHIAEARQYLAHQKQAIGQEEVTVETEIAVGPPAQAEAKELAHLIKGSAKLCCGCEVSKASHGVVALFDATMILFYEIIEVVTTLVENFSAKGLTYCSWIGNMPIGGDSLWCMAHRLERLLEKSLRCIHIPFLAQHRVNEIAISINGPIQVTPLPLHFDVGFINMPNGSSTSTPPGSQLIC